MNSGVYVIQNTVNNKIYIGSSNKIKKRFYNHIKFLREGKHHSAHLQNSFNKYGESSFVFKVVLVCSADNLIMYEQLFLDYYKSYKIDRGFNIANKAGTPRPYITTDKMKENLKKALRARARKHLVNGEMLCVAEVSEKYNIRFKVLEGRLAKGMSLQEAISFPQRNEVNRKFLYEGQMLKIDEIAKELGMNINTAKTRLSEGWSIEKIINTPVVNNIKLIEYNGKKQSMSKWAKELGIAQQTMMNRLSKLGWSVERAFTTMPKKAT